MAVTTFRPPSAPVARKPAAASGSKAVTITLGVVAALFAGGAGFLYTQLSQQTARVTTMSDGLVQIAESAKSGALSPSDLANPALAGEAINNLAAAVGTLVSEGEAARADASRQRQQVQELTSEKEATAVRLSTIQGQLEAARAEAQKSNQKTVDLQKRYDTEVADFNKRITGLNNQIAELDTLVGDLNIQVEELTAAKQRAEEAAAKVAAASSASGGAPAGVVASPAADAGDFGAEDPAATAMEKNYFLEIPEGTSKLFTAALYDPVDQSLTFTTVDSRTLYYTGVPAEIFDGLAAAPLVDVFFRFRILDKYVSDPKDVDFIPSVRAD